MDNQEIAEALKWAAVEIETGRPNWPEVLRAGIELVSKVRPLAEGHYMERLGRLCARCGNPLGPVS